MNAFMNGVWVVFTFPLFTTFLMLAGLSYKLAYLDETCVCASKLLQCLLPVACVPSSCVNNFILWLGEEGESCVEKLLRSPRNV